MHTARIVPGTLGVALIALLFQAGSGTLIAQQPLPVSKGVYRLPYQDGTSVRFSNDHTNHPTTLNRVDMTGQGTAPFVVVAAAAGWIRIIVENRDTFCPNACGATATTPENDCDGDGVTTPQDNQQAQQNACGNYNGATTFCCERDFEANGGTCPGAGTCLNGPNNFVWIEHPNGEWTKYTHMLRGSVGPGTDNNGNPGAGRFEGEFVAAGTPIGIEGDVGFASGPHVHFEVGVPNYVELLAELQALNAVESDPDFPFATTDDWFNNGFLVGDGVVDDVDGDGTDDVNRQNRIPVFCQVGFANAGDINTAGPCNDQCDDPISDLSGFAIVPGSIFYSQVPATMGNPNGDFVIQPFAGAAIRAGTRVTLSPGFRALGDSYFSASIGACDTPGGIGE
jgi:hypothetical protein